MITVLLLFATLIPSMFCICMFFAMRGAAGPEVRPILGGWGGLSQGIHFEEEQPICPTRR